MLSLWKRGSGRSSSGPLRGWAATRALRRCTVRDHSIYIYTYINNMIHPTCPYFRWRNEGLTAECVL